MSRRSRNRSTQRPFGKVPKHRKRSQKKREEQRRRVHDSQQLPFHDIEANQSQEFGGPEPQSHYSKFFDAQSAPIGQESDDSDSEYFDVPSNPPEYTSDAHLGYHVDEFYDRPEDDPLFIAWGINDPMNKLLETGEEEETNGEYLDAEQNPDDSDFFDALDPNKCYFCHQSDATVNLFRPCPECLHRWHFVCMARWLVATWDDLCWSCHTHYFQHPWLWRGNINGVLCLVIDCFDGWDWSLFGRYTIEIGSPQPEDTVIKGVGSR